MDQQFTTPMMKQYEGIKKEYQDCLLFYRMGDFYELFLEDAHIGAKILDITLTSRAKGKDGRIPMAGVPYHAVDPYLHKLVKAGHKVAICEQVSEPNKKGIIDRQVVRVVTPGTILDQKALNQKENNFIISLIVNDTTLAIAACDISTGQFMVLERDASNLAQTIRDECGTIQPSECILSEEDYHNPMLIKLLRQERTINVTCFKKWNEVTKKPDHYVKEHFKIASLESFGIEKKSLSVHAAAALLGFLKETQKDQVRHITSIHTLQTQDHLTMDRSTINNLELFNTLRDNDDTATLIGVMDKTKTAMGARLLRRWMKKPLVDTQHITDRYDAVDELITNKDMFTFLGSAMSDITDIERLLSRVSVGLGNARDIVTMSQSIRRILHIKEYVSTNATSSLLTKQNDSIDDGLQQLTHLIDATLVTEPPISIREGGMIQSGINTRLDELRSHIGGNKEWIANLEMTERKRTSISSLKVRYNRVFGFYIEISHANKHLVPDNYIRKQTLVNGERYITPELKHYEELILTAQHEIYELEYQLFSSLVLTVIKETTRIQQSCMSISIIDCIYSFADIALTFRYTRPVMSDTDQLDIVDGRHPVVERLLTDSQFVPNSVTLNSKHNQLLLITGPNMAGKSVFIRQVALLVLMAQMGSFIPATRATMSIVDRLFVRSGASDVITQGLSTFMVEMVETAYILNHATRQSLIVMDEIGRGTSTYDGISIAWAIAEYLVTHEKNPAKTLFATHYHELQQLEHIYPKSIKNYHMEVIQEEETPIFLHTLQPGGASASFGIAVAKLAGIPETVINKAETLLHTLEQTHRTNNKERDTTNQSRELSLTEKTIKTLDLQNTTPLQALTLLSDLQNNI